MKALIQTVKRTRTVALAALLVAIPFASRAQLSSTPETIRTFPLPEPREDDAALSEHKRVLRGEVPIDSLTNVRFYESPTSEVVYNSSVVVERKGVEIANYNVGQLIQHQTLRLVHTALLRSGDTGMLVCEYEGGATGAREGFAILRFSLTSVELRTLPLTDFGKVVVFRAHPELAEVWTALPDDAGAAADGGYYAKRLCRWGDKNFVCGPPKRMSKRFLPGDIDDPGIEIRP